MANKVFNIQGGVYSGAAFSAFENRMYGTSVASTASFKCTAGSGMTISISSGDGIIANSNDYAYRIQSTTANTVTVSTAPTVSGQSRYDAIVAYIDLSVTPDTSKVDNVDAGILKYTCVAGTAATSPSTSATDAKIQTAVGAGNPYMVLAYVLVPYGGTVTSSMTISDARAFAGTRVQVSTTDITEGSYLPSGTIYGVYE